MKIKVIENHNWLHNEIRLKFSVFRNSYVSPLKNNTQGLVLRLCDLLSRTPQRSPDTCLMRDLCWIMKRWVKQVTFCPPSGRLCNLPPSLKHPPRQPRKTYCFTLSESNKKSLRCWREKNMHVSSSPVSLFIPSCEFSFHSLFLLLITV